MATRPHALNPTTQSIRLILAYRAYPGLALSHIGLGVSALNTSQVLRRHGIWADVWPISSAAELRAKLLASDAAAALHNEIRVSHVVISAPWVPTLDLSGLVSEFTNIDWAIISHSNVAFLHADPRATILIGEAMSLQQQWHNFRLGANSAKFCGWLYRAYGCRPAYLPNLYNLEHTEGNEHRPAFRGGGPLRIGSFGAVRILKNHVTSAAAAIEISRRLGVDTEFWMSGGRSEGSAGVMASIEGLIGRSVQCKLQVFNWASWPDFHQAIRKMNLLLQPSFTESFNMVSADGVAQGVPSVVSDAIEWVPDNWQAHADDATDIANKGIALLYDPSAPSEGRRALQAHNRTGITVWTDYLLPRVQ